MVERQVDAHHERIAEEHREADEPGAHEQEHEATAPPRRALPAPPALHGENGRRYGACAYGTPPPPLACLTCASSCLSRSANPPARSFTLPACHLVAKV